MSVPHAAPGGRAPLPPVTLVLGGARSGKSAYAERLIAAAADADDADPGAPVAGTYVATAEPGDAEMAERIRRHRERRGDRWQTVEEPLALAATLRRVSRRDRPVLVDCLTLWLANLMAVGRRPEEEAAMLADALAGLAGPVVLVANEVGLGLVPETPLGRTFRDAAGRLNQEIARSADRVVFVAAGLPLTLKDRRKEAQEGRQR